MVTFLGTASREDGCVVLAMTTYKVDDPVWSLSTLGKWEEAEFHCYGGGRSSQLCYVKVVSHGEQVVRWTDDEVRSRKPELAGADNPDDE